MLSLSNTMLSVVAFVLIVLAFFAFYVAFKGKLHSEKLIANNVISTKVTILISIFALRTDQLSYVDVALVYAMMSFITTVIIARYMGRKAKQKVEKVKKEDMKEIQDA